MRLKITSDGTNVGTQVRDEETGRVVTGVLGISWEMTEGGIVTTLRLQGVPVELVADVPELAAPALEAKAVEVPEPELPVEEDDQAEELDAEPEAPALEAVAVVPTAGGSDDASAAGSSSSDVDLDEDEEGEDERP